MGKLYVENRRVISKKNGLVIIRLVKTILLLLVGFTMVLPFLWMLSTSFKLESEVFTYPIQWIPKQFMWENHHEVWFGRNSFFIFYFNSIKVTLMTVFGQVIISSLAAYAFARINFAGRDAVFLLYLATMMVPPQVTIIPKFLLFDSVGLTDSHFSIVVQSMFLIFGVFMLRQAYISIPFELSESAKIDGAGELRIWSRIVGPMAKPAVTSLVILSFVWTWNDYQTPLIFLRSKELYTIPLGLDFFMDDMGTKYSLIMAGAVSAILPMVIVYLVGQKQFIQSVAMSGVKG